MTPADLTIPELLVFAGALVGLVVVHCMAIREARVLRGEVG